MRTCFASLCCVLLMVAGPAALRASEAPDGTSFTHPVLAVEGADLVRIRYCGLPLQVRLANVQFKTPEAQKQAQQFLREQLKTGLAVKVDVEPELNAEQPFPPLVQLFASNQHMNVELVKRGFAISDGRSQKFANAFQSAQMDAMTRKAGVWATQATPAKPIPAPEVVTATVKTASTQPVASAAPVMEVAPEDYAGLVVADLNSREYHLPGSRYAQSIRAGARIEYKSPDEAERAGKQPSPFSFPTRAKIFASRRPTGGGGINTVDGAISEGRKALEDALAQMQEARKHSRTNNSVANQYWKKAAKILSEMLDRITPVADSNPDNATLQKLTEDMSMNLYSCNKYQSL